MQAGHSADELVAIVRANVPSTWLDNLLSTPDGTALLYGMLDDLAAESGFHADDWSQHFVAPASTQIAPTASGATLSTTTFGVTLRKQHGIPLVMPAGTRLRTVDGHLFVMTSSLTFGVGEVGVQKSVDGVAVVPGILGDIPAGEMVPFAKIANGLSGIGTALALSSTSIPAEPKALRFTTDMTQPSPFKSFLVGLYIEILDVADITKNALVGQLFSIASVTNIAIGVGPADPEDAHAWTLGVDTTTDSRYANVPTGTFGYTWVARDWDDLGFEAVTLAPVANGRSPVLDQLAQERGRPRQPGEGDDELRARLMAKPDAPVPLGLLRKVVRAVASYGLGLPDVQIYEWGLGGASATSRYHAQFPPALGWIWDCSVFDLSSVDPANYAAYDPSYAALVPPPPNPGPALFVSATPPWIVSVRCDAIDGFSFPSEAVLRAKVFAAMQAGKSPGAYVQFFHADQWGF